MAIDNQIIRSGSRKRWVEMVQKQLIRENPSALPNFGVDGGYGEETADWVMRFQEKKGLQVDGVAGPDTLQQLRSDIVLRPGDSGNGVELLQEDLAYFYIQQTAVDGEYGPGTQQGVRDFQFLNNLVVDGSAGPNTLKKMDELITTLLVQSGDSGSLVRRIQNQLNDQDEVDISINVDGEYGSATEAAVEEFQEAMDQRVDGIAGPVTMNLLDLEAFHPLENAAIMDFVSSSGSSINSVEVTNASDISDFRDALLNHPVIQDKLPSNAVENSTIIEHNLMESVVYVAHFSLEDTTTYAYAQFTSDKELEAVAILEIDGDLYEDDATLTTYDVDGEVVDEVTDTNIEFTNDTLNVQLEIAEAISEASSQFRVNDEDGLDIACALGRTAVAELICTVTPLALGISFPGGLAVSFVLGQACTLMILPFTETRFTEWCD